MQKKISSSTHRHLLIMLPDVTEKACDEVPELLKRRAAERHELILAHVFVPRKMFCILDAVVDEITQVLAPGN